MSKIEITSPLINRISLNDKLTMTCKLNFNALDNINGNGTITLKCSTTNDFSSTSSVIPETIEYEEDGVWTAIVGNNLNSEIIGKPLRIKKTENSVESVDFIKIVYTEDEKVFESLPILFTSLTEMIFNMQNSISTGNTRPTKIKITDVIEAKVESTYSIRVEVTNNALDTIPVWEDMTQTYIDRGFYTFTNQVKESNKPWAISVRYFIRKNLPSDEIEISEFYVSFI